MARSVGSVCSLVLVWLCALGAGPARHPAGQPLVARSAVAVALRDVAEAPLLGTRALAGRAAPARVVERDLVPTFSWFATAGEPSARGTRHVTRMTLVRQSAAHDQRPRWRAYDAAAPPAHSRTAR
jgi:hypothetical protein